MSLHAVQQPTRRRGEARREEILRIAQDVFLAEGYAAASMSAIAARVGGSKGTLYNHFRSKEELFAAFVDHACGVEVATAFDFSNLSADDLEGRLRQAGRRFVRFVLSDTAAAVHRVVIAECGRFPELGRAFFEAGPRVNLLRLASFLEGEMAAGRLRRADPHKAAEHFLELVRAGLHQRRMWNVGGEPTDTEIDANVEAGLEVFLAAYGTR